VSPGIFVFLERRHVSHALLEPLALAPAIAALGFELVDVRIAGTPARRVVRIRIDVPGGGRPGHGVTTDDCRRVSRELEAQLEAAGAVAAQWELEVSSPGIERPVRFAEHWRRYVGRSVRLKAEGVRGKATATIVAVPDDGHVALDLDGTTVTLPLEAIREATLVVDWSTIGKREVGES
jgi:ribosome maturation factor RimP